MQRRPETACEQQAAAVMAQLVSAAVGPSSPVAEGEANANDRPKSNRQRYVSVACDFCKRRHARCDAVQPRCSLCNRFNEECTYEIEMRKKGRKKRSMEENGPDLMQSSPSSPASVHHVPPQAATVVAEGPVPAATSPTDVGARAQPLGMALVHSLGQQVTTFDRQSLTEFMDAFSRCHFSELLFGVEQQSPNEPCHTSGNRVLSDCCRSSRQFLAFAALATGAFNSHRREASDVLCKQAEAMFVSQELLDLPVINVAKGMLLIANYAHSVGKIHKSSSYCLLVLHHSSLMEKQLPQLTSRVQAGTIETMRTTFSAMKVWASTLLIANETDPEVALSYFQKAKDLPCPAKEKLALYLQIMRIEILSGLIARQYEEVAYRAPLDRMAEFEQLFQGALKFPILGTVEVSNDNAGGGSGSGGCCDSHSNSLKCTYYSLKAALLVVTGNMGSARAYAQECISVATDAHTICKICSINHALALALVGKLYLMASDFIAVFGVLCLMQAFSKMFDATNAIIWKARNCLPQQYHVSEQLVSQPSVNMLSTRRYMEEVLFEAYGPPPGQQLQQPTSMVASNSAVSGSTLPPSPSPLPILHTIGVEQFLQDLAHELPPLDLNPSF